MIRLLGEISLFIALACASLQTILPLLGRHKNNIYLYACGPGFALAQFLFISMAYFILTIAFVVNDFSLSYVAANSHYALPLFYKLTAVWGAHEGSILLWVLLLSTWTIIFSSQETTSLRYLVLSILGLISVCFLTFLCFTSNPFTPAIIPRGNDLNPLLQDPGFMVHPPMLYIGYVGMAVPFALTSAALINGNLDLNWARLTRRYTIAAWCFLTAGITLGSWWAYRVLGWGGFWFWDPVENASLLPWLCAIALIHILILVEKQAVAQLWAALLAIICFTLSVLGTFLVRSGVLVSVHTFASDPKRGSFLLILLAAITTGALFLHVKHSMALNKNKLTFYWLSRETGLLVNTILIFTSLITILLGTLYPLIIDALHLGNLSVGAPYFNKVLTPIVFLSMFAMGLIVYLRWEKDQVRRLLTVVFKNLSISLSVAAIIIYCMTQYFNWSSFITLSLSFLVLISAFEQRKKSFGMTVAHGGFAILIIGVMLSNALSIEKEVSVKTGNAVDIGPYQFFFMDTQTVVGPNYHGIRAAFDVMKGKHHITRLYPEKRIYPIREMVMTKVDIHPSVFRDLYIALGQPLDENYWSVRIYFKPFIRWIWGGGVIMTLGGILILLQKRSY